MAARPTSKTKLRRLRERGKYDAESVYKILDDNMICHLALIRNGSDGDQPYPVALPMLYARVGDSIMLHGSVSMGIAKSCRREPIAASMTVTELNGLVYARSLFSSSVNYRSAVCFGQLSTVEDDDERLNAFQQITQHSLGEQRWHDARQPNAAELKSTVVLRLDIESASCKERNGPPHDQDADIENGSDVWAGVVPLVVERKPAISDDLAISSDVQPPPYVCQ